MTKSDGWVDVHAHFYPPANQEELESRLKSWHAGDFLVPEPYVWRVEDALEYMDKAGIQMQLLSYIPLKHDALRIANDYAASVVAKHPTRFGLLAALPTDDPDASLAEIERSSKELKCDGFAVTTHYNGVCFSDDSLVPVWRELDKRGATVFMHPDALTPSSKGRPAPLIEVAFDTARTLTDIVYKRLLLKFPNITLIAAHCGGSFPALSGRILALGTEVWVPNPTGVTREELEKQMKKLFVDTAATATVHTLSPVLAMCGCKHIVYGSDSGVPCSTVKTVEANRHSLLEFDGLTKDEIQGVGRRALDLFPTAAQRVETA